MPTQLERDEALSPADTLLADHIGNEVYAAHYSERRLSRFIIGTLSVLLLFAFLQIHSLASRPIADRYIRIDEMGRAQAIQYTDLNYSPREGEVRTYLTDWANYRYTVNRETVASKYPLNYYFLSQRLEQYTMRSGQEQAASTVATAARGVDLSSGSAVAQRASEQLVEQLDVNTINANTTRAAWTQRTAATNYSNEAMLDSVSAKNLNASASTISPALAATTSLLGSASGLASQWDWRRQLQYSIPSSSPASPSGGF